MYLHKLFAQTCPLTESLSHPAIELHPTMQPREEEHSGKKYFKTEKKICRKGNFYHYGISMFKQGYCEPLLSMLAQITLFETGEIRGSCFFSMKQQECKMYCTFPMAVAPAVMCEKLNCF